MPHFGLIDEDALGPVESQLMRAKLHIRCGKRRLREGKISMGILTLYDALNSAMQWYIAIPENRMALKTNEGENLNDDDTVYAVLTRCGILDGSFDYDAFNELVEDAGKKIKKLFVQGEHLNEAGFMVLYTKMMPVLNSLLRK